MKGIVMETRGSKAAVLLKDGTFRAVKGHYTIGETVEYKESAIRSVKRWAAAAAVMLMLGSGGYLYDTNLTACAEVSVDVNPSIIYTVNKRSQVLSVRAGNDDAAELVQALQQEGIRFTPVSAAIEKTFHLLEAQGYMNAEDEDYVLVNISADSRSVQDSLTSQVEEGVDLAQTQNPTMEVRIDHSDRDTAQKAAEHHMSPGRYAAWEQAGDANEPEAYAEKPVRDILMNGAPQFRPAAPGEPPAPHLPNGQDGPGSFTEPDTGNPQDHPPVAEPPAPPQADAQAPAEMSIPEGMPEPGGTMDRSPGQTSMISPENTPEPAGMAEQKLEPSQANEQPASMMPPAEGILTKEAPEIPVPSGMPQVNIAASGQPPAQQSEAPATAESPGSTAALDSKPGILGIAPERDPAPEMPGSDESTSPAAPAGAAPETQQLPAQETADRKDLPAAMERPGSSDSPAAPQGSAPEALHDAESSPSQPCPPSGAGMPQMNGPIQNMSQQNVDKQQANPFAQSPSMEQDGMPDQNPVYHQGF